MASQFVFTKLVVGDLDKCATFYEAVCGLSQQARIDAVVDGRDITEIVYAPTNKGGANFVLFAYHDSPKPKRDETIIGFSTDDIEGFAARIRAHGGEVYQGPDDRPEHGLKVAFARDIEGHVIELIQPLAAAS
jgi:predicted enzyme related to lactoylglutathione lyase